MKARCWLCTRQEETEKAGGGVCVRLWRISCLLTLDVFFCQLGQVSNKSPPPIMQCPSRFTLGAMERDLGADLKKQLLAEAPGRAIKYLPKKLKPIATQAEKLTEGDSRAFVERYFGPLLLSLWSANISHTRPECDSSISWTSTGSFQRPGC